MKTFLLVFVFTIVSFFSGLKGHAQALKESLSVSKFANFEETIGFEDYEVTFKKVISDSRCPKSVMCIRAGEAKVLVSIYKNGEFIEDVETKIDASGYVTEDSNLAYQTKFLKIYCYSLLPYPNDVNPIADEAYQLEVVFNQTN